MESTGLEEEKLSFQTLEEVLPGTDRYGWLLELERIMHLHIHMMESIGLEQERVFF
jgi:hypothetical protein